MEESPIVLIVDDELAGQEALEGALFSQGYRLVFSDNGQDAYQKALEEIPDVILLDVMMPGQDGFEVCRRLRSDPLLAELPILLVTALDDHTSRIKGIEAGADDFISKPFDRIELRARLRTITRLNRFRRLLLERSRFIWVVDQASEGYIVLNPEGFILYANSAARILLNFSSEEKLTETFRNWVRKYYICEPEERWKDMQKPAELNSPLFLIRPETPVHKPVWIQVEILHFPYEDNQSTLLKLTEITQHLALRQEIWSFHSMIFHKLQTPFASMRMAGDLLMRQIERQEYEGLSDLADAVLNGINRLGSEIRDVLFYTNSQNITRMGKNICVGDLPRLVSVICQDHGIENFSVSTEEDISKEITLVLSGQAVEVILREILENAKKFHPTLSPHIDVLISRAQDQKICIAIQDDGINLSPEQLEQVWLPYYQAEKEFTGEVKGMGLGLSTVATLLWEVRGKCLMINRVDRPGVIVELYIPQEISVSNTLLE